MGSHPKQAKPTAWLIMETCGEPFFYKRKRINYIMQILLLIAVA